MKFDLQSILLTYILPLLLSQGVGAADKWLDTFAVSDPEWHKTLLIVLYRVASVHGAELVASTANTYDDAAMNALIAELKANATKHGITVQ